MLRDAHHGQKCPYCRRTMSSRDARLHPTRDHVVPASRGGREKVICCLTCNGIKADMLPEQWQAFMAAYPAYYLMSRLELRRVRRAAFGLRSLPRVRGVRQVIVPPELIYGASQLPAERKDQ